MGDASYDARQVGDSTRYDGQPMTSHRSLAVWRDTCAHGDRLRSSLDQLPTAKRGVDVHAGGSASQHQGGASSSTKYCATQTQFASSSQTTPQSRYKRLAAADQVETPQVLAHSSDIREDAGPGLAPMLTREVALHRQGYTVQPTAAAISPHVSSPPPRNRSILTQLTSSSEALSPRPLSVASLPPSSLGRASTPRTVVTPRESHMQGHHSAQGSGLGSAPSLAEIAPSHQSSIPCPLNPDSRLPVLPSCPRDTLSTAPQLSQREPSAVRHTTRPQSLRQQTQNFAEGADVGLAPSLGEVPYCQGSMTSQVNSASCWPPSSSHLQDLPSNQQHVVPHVWTTHSSSMPLSHSVAEEDPNRPGDNYTSVASHPAMPSRVEAVPSHRTLIPAAAEQMLQFRSFTDDANIGSRSPPTEAVSAHRGFIPGQAGPASDPPVSCRAQDSSNMAKQTFTPSSLSTHPPSVVSSQPISSCGHASSTQYTASPRELHNQGHYFAEAPCFPDALPVRQSSIPCSANSALCLPIRQTCLQHGDGATQQVSLPRAVSSHPPGVTYSCGQSAVPCQTGSAACLPPYSQERCHCTQQDSLPRTVSPQPLSVASVPPASAVLAQPSHRQLAANPQALQSQGHQFLIDGMRLEPDPPCTEAVPRGHGWSLRPPNSTSCVHVSSSCPGEGYNMSLPQGPYPQRSIVASTGQIANSLQHAMTAGVPACASSSSGACLAEGGPVSIPEVSRAELEKAYVILNHELQSERKRHAIERAQLEKYARIAAVATRSAEQYCCLPVNGPFAAEEHWVLESLAQPLREKSAQEGKQTETHLRENIALLQEELRQSREYKLSKEDHQLRVQADQEIHETKSARAENANAVFSAHPVSQQMQEAARTNKETLDAHGGFLSQAIQSNSQIVQDRCDQVSHDVQTVAREVKAGTDATRGQLEQLMQQVQEVGQASKEAGDAHANSLGEALRAHSQAMREHTAKVSEEIQMLAQTMQVGSETMKVQFDQVAQQLRQAGQAGRETGETHASSLGEVKASVKGIQDQYQMLAHSMQAGSEAMSAQLGQVKQQILEAEQASEETAGAHAQSLDQVRLTVQAIHDQSSHVAHEIETLARTLQVGSETMKVQLGLTEQQTHEAGQRSQEAAKAHDKSFDDVRKQVNAVREQSNSDSQENRLLAHAMHAGSETKSCQSDHAEKLVQDVGQVSERNVIVKQLDEVSVDFQGTQDQSRPILHGNQVPPDAARVEKMQTMTRQHDRVEQKIHEVGQPSVEPIKEHAASPHEIRLDDKVIHGSSDVSHASQLPASMTRVGSDIVKSTFDQGQEAAAGTPAESLPGSRRSSDAAMHAATSQDGRRHSKITIDLNAHSTIVAGLDECY